MWVDHPPSVSDWLGKQTKLFLAPGNNTDRVGYILYVYSSVWIHFTFVTSSTPLSFTVEQNKCDLSQLHLTFERASRFSLWTSHFEKQNEKTFSKLFLPTWGERWLISSFFLLFSWELWMCPLAPTKPPHDFSLFSCYSGKAMDELTCDRSHLL